MKPVVLCLFRHGAAEDLSPAVAADAKRALTEQGRIKTRAAALGLRRLDAGFDAVLVSPWLRAVQTAAILAEVLSLAPPQILPELAGDRSVEELLRALTLQRGTRTVLVGHQPLLGSTAAALLDPSGGLVALDLRKSGACALQLDSFPQRRPASLLWLMTSRQLRMIGQE